MTTDRAVQQFEELLEFVRDTRAFDYTSYKRPSLMRRFEKRMQAVGVESYEDYRHYLEAEPKEFHELFNTILINVTAFFRDPAAWQYLAEETVPKIVAGKGENDPIRVWSAGCATGEEAYTAGILLAEQLGDEAFRSRVKIYATDVDDEALTEARHAIFSPRRVEGVAEELAEKYFQRLDDTLVVRGDIRRAVIFGRNDLIADPPISRVDLIVSRNTLMYFGAQAQERILSNFYFALNPGGYLFLGKAEALMSRTNLFSPVDLKYRIFQPSDSASPELRLGAAAPPPVPPIQVREERRLRDATFEHAPHAQVVIDLAGDLSLINHAARSLFGLTAQDIGKPFRDLEVSYRPVELRSRIDKALEEGRPVVLRDVVWPAPDGSERHFDVTVAPVTAHGGDMVGVSISFVDVSRAEVMRAELEQTRRELETAYEELQSTVEELETTNEELQSTNEELETTNEELQSTNEELETMNEELHSTNEELETMNDELRDRTDEALIANAFLTSILGSIEQSVVVVDPNLVVTAWSKTAEELWGVRSEEATGAFLLNLDIGVSVQDLREPIREVLAEGTVEPMILEGHDRRGNPIRVTVAFAPLRAHTGDGRGVILTMSAERIDVRT